MKITWLGQAGLYLEAGGQKIIIDPYLSNSVAKINPQNNRRMAVDERFLSVVPDILICTHNHLDHNDPETMSHYLGSGGACTVLAPAAPWEALRKYGGTGTHNYVLFNRHTRWTAAEVVLYAVAAAHSDPHPIGVVLEAEGKRLYITGDTLYNTDVLADVRSHGRLDAVFLPINGVGNNMNMADAAEFCRALSPRVAVPLHWGLFDSLKGDDWDYDPKIVPQIYREFEL